MNLNGLLVHQFPEGSTYEFLNPILQTLSDILWPILIVVAAIGTIYAIYLGVMMAKAENAEKREESKKRIINAVIALVVTVVLISLMQIFINFAPSIIGEGIITEPEGEGLIGLLKMKF